MPRRLTVSGRALSGWVVLILLTGLLAALPASAAPPKCFGQPATIKGTSGDDELRGTKRRDVIVARGGNDIIEARGGNDLVCAGRGAFDIVFAGAGDDRVEGAGGFDAMFPAAGNDLFIGGRGFDMVTYEGSPEAVRVDLGRQTARGQGRDRLRGVESVGGSEAGDRLVGTNGPNELLGFGGNDTVIAHGGDDFLNSGAGDDSIDGGEGQDFLDIVVSNGGPGLGDDTLTDVGATVDLAAGTVTGPEGVGNDVLTSVESSSGTLGDDTLRGSAAFNDLFALEGNDTISVGEPGEPDALGTQDVVVPGPGNDVVNGSSGVDAVDYGFLSLDVDPTAGVSIDLQAGTATGADIGTDQLNSIETAVGTSFDDVIRGTSGPNHLLGFEGSDSLEGRAGDDVLDGDAFLFGANEDLNGVDVLNGGPGNDTCLGGSPGDTECESTTLPGWTSARWSLGGARQPSDHLGYSSSR